MYRLEPTNLDLVDTETKAAIVGKFHTLYNNQSLTIWKVKEVVNEKIKFHTFNTYTDATEFIPVDKVAGDYTPPPIVEEFDRYLVVDDASGYVKDKSFSGLFKKITGKNTIPAGLKLATNVVVYDLPDVVEVGSCFHPSLGFDVATIKIVRTEPSELQLNRYERIMEETTNLNKTNRTKLENILIMREGLMKQNTYLHNFDVIFTFFATSKDELDRKVTEFRKNMSRLRVKVDQPKFVQKDLYLNRKPKISGFSFISNSTTLDTFYPFSSMELIETGKRSVMLGKNLQTGSPVIYNRDSRQMNYHVVIVGTTGCLTGGSRVVLGSGEMVRIEDMGQTHLQQINERVYTSEGSGKVDTATTFFKYTKQPIIEVITESGKSIKGTYNHPLLTCNSGVNQWKTLDQLQIGDILRTTQKVRCYLKNPKLTGFKITSNHFGPQYKGKVPQYMTEELAAICGYVIGDGYVRKKALSFVVAQDEQDIAENLTNYMTNLFGLQPQVEYRTLNNGSINGRMFSRTVSMIDYNYHSYPIVEMMMFLKDKRVPDLIFKSPDSVVASFLKWLFEADGHINMKNKSYGYLKPRINLTSINIELLRDVQLLLLRFGIQCVIHGTRLDINRKDSVRKYIKHIGFASIKKQTKLSQCVQYLNNERTQDRKRPIGEAVVSIIRHDEPQDVYDIEVPISHRFVANGIVSHNSGKSMTTKVFMYRLWKNITEDSQAVAVIIDPSETKEYKNLAQAIGIEYKSLDQGIGIDPLHYSAPVATSILTNLFSLTKIQSDVFIRVIEAIQAKKGTVEDLEAEVSKLGVKEHADLINAVHHGMLKYGYIFKGKFPEHSFAVSTFSNDDNAVLAASTMVMLRTREYFSSLPLETAKFLVVDEGWKLLEDKYAAETLSSISREGRKSNITMIFITQAPKDILENRTGSIILNNCDTKILMKTDASHEIAQVLSLSNIEENLLKTTLDKSEPGQALLLAGHKHVYMRVMVEPEEMKAFTTKAIHN